jgi:hypothetical protein
MAGTVVVKGPRGTRGREEMIALSMRCNFYTHVFSSCARFMETGDIYRKGGVGNPIGYNFCMI